MQEIKELVGPVGEIKWRKMNNFITQLQDSKDTEISNIWNQKYRLFPGLKEILLTDLETDKLGGDKILVFENRNLYVDEKLRTTSYNDILLEIISNNRTGKAGWAVDLNKITDILGYAVPNLNIVYFYKFKKLRTKLLQNLVIWKEHDDCTFPIKALNRSYTTISIGVPPEFINDCLLITMKWK